METSLTDMFFTFARLVSVKVENQSDHVLPPVWCCESWEASQLVSLNFDLVVITM